jgi:hypothetical protein
VVELDNENTPDFFVSDDGTGIIEISWAKLCVKKHSVRISIGRIRLAEEDCFM